MRLETLGLRPPRLLEVIPRLHLGEPARRAVELELHRLQPRVHRFPLEREELARRGLGGEDEFYALIVEHVNQQRESTGLVGAREPVAPRFALAANANDSCSTMCGIPPLPTMAGGAAGCKGGWAGS